MDYCNFNLLGDQDLERLGLGGDQRLAIDPLRPLNSIFDLLDAPSIDPKLIGDLIDQGVVVSTLDRQFAGLSTSLISGLPLVGFQLASTGGKKGQPDTGATDPQKDFDEADRELEELERLFKSILQALRPTTIVPAQPQPSIPSVLIPGTPLTDCESKLRIRLVGMGMAMGKTPLGRKDTEATKRRTEADLLTSVQSVAQFNALNDLELRFLGVSSAPLCANERCSFPRFTFGRQVLKEIKSVSSRQLSFLSFFSAGPKNVRFDEVVVAMSMYSASNIITLECVPEPQ